MVGHVDRIRKAGSGGGLGGVRGDSVGRVHFDSRSVDDRVYSSVRELMSLGLDGCGQMISLIQMEILDREAGLESVR